MARRRRSGIRINPANKGKMRRTAGAKRGQKVPISTLRRLKKSRNPTTRKRATFALNVRLGRIGGGRRRRR
jgi:hypothetical protein